ncbi:hypothetical protein J7L60_06175 [Candidatus Bathyarchaeota archaeon]|nr:hypothetical protein [Candidatus Bathyarchaeota archaeon]
MGEEEKEDYTVPVYIGLKHSIVVELDNIAAEWGTTVSRACQRIITEYVKNWVSEKEKK